MVHLLQIITLGVCPEMHAVPKMAKIRQNHQFHQANVALMNLTEIHQNRQILERFLSLSKFRQICHFHHCLHFWTYERGKEGVIDTLKASPIQIPPWSNLFLKNLVIVRGWFFLSECQRFLNKHICYRGFQIGILKLRRVTHQ